MPVVPRRTRARFAIATGAALPALGVAAFLAISAAATQPQAPSSFHGTVTIGGNPPPEGVEVRSLIDGIDCTQANAGSSNIVRSGENAAYVVDVVHEDQRPGCGREGKTVTFTVGGLTATQTGEWKIGVQKLDLDAPEGDALQQLTGGAGSLAGPRESAAGTGTGFPIVATAALVLGTMAVTGMAAGFALRRRAASQPSPVSDGDLDGGPRGEP